MQRCAKRFVNMVNDEMLMFTECYMSEVNRSRGSIRVYLLEKVSRISARCRRKFYRKNELLLRAYLW